jgi:hypothetical protein
MSFSYSESFSLGDRVQITRDGAKEHRKYIQSCALGAGVAAGAVALPAALPGSIAAGIGIVSGGAGIGVSAGAVAGVGGAAGAGVGKVVENFLHFPELATLEPLLKRKTEDSVVLAMTTESSGMPKKVKPLSQLGIGAAI